MAKPVLNEDQRQAVEQIEGPVMVIAGPGTGKTQVLANRIANILQKTDTDPRSILALTFTESAASNMRERLVSMIGKTGYYVQISTFHSFCAEVISSHPEYFEIDRDSEPLSDLERYDFFSQIINQEKLEVLKPVNRPLFYLRDIMGAISNLKRENISIDEFEVLIDDEAKDLELDLKKTARTKLEKKIAKNKELNLIFAQYQKMLRENLRFDYDDMIALVVDAFTRHEELLLEYQENILYFLVDEYQDTNSAQNKIVDLLAYSTQWQDKANVFVVGDPNQSIYRFQGASVENALSFTDKYPEAKLITLTTGYRCPQNIYDIAHHLISENNLTKQNSLSPTLNPARTLMLDRLNQKLSSSSTIESVVTITKSPSKTVEIINLAETIKKLISAKIEPKDIAVLFRNNADAHEIKEILGKWNIPFEINTNNNILETLEISQFLNLLHIINHVTNDDRNLDIFGVMNFSWLGLDSLAVMKATKIASLNKLSILELLERNFDQISEQASEFKLDEKLFLELQLFLNKLREWKNADANMVFTAWFEKILEESGFLEFIKNHPNKLELIGHLKSLFDQIKSLNSSNHQLNLSSFLSAIELMGEHNISISSESIRLDKNAVHLSTVHKAKGQEWDYVFMVDLVDKKWGNTRQKDLLPLPTAMLKNTDLGKKESNEDDRRLFYVGLTRARKGLFLSWSQTKANGNLEKSQVETMFFSELGNQNAIKQNEVSSMTAEKLLKLIAPSDIPQQSNIDEKEFFTKLVSKFILSPTSLNTYLRDPAEFVLNTLLKLPRAKEVHMSFGTAVHAALEFLFKHYKKNGAYPALELVLKNFKLALQKEILSRDDFSRRLKLGEKFISLYYHSNTKDGLEVMDLEKQFGDVRNRVILDNDIHLSGRIDRIDWIDKAKKQIKVIDYKTGKPKSENEINGLVGTAKYSQRELDLPENIRGAYKRQLLFYKLLTDLDERFPFSVTHASFEFIEPNPSGKQVSRVFEIHDQDVEDLKNLIRTVMTEIKDLKFMEVQKS